MGEIAEMLLNGDLDSDTGEYIGPGNGHPRTLYGIPHRKEIMSGCVFGVNNFLQKKGIFGKQRRAFVAAYCKEELDFDFIIKGYEAACVEIQNNFPNFANYIDKQLGKQKQ